VLSFVEKYKDRIISIHLKDFVENYESISENEAFAAIGDGVLPTEQILDKLSELHMIEHGLMIDQDKPAKGAVITDDLHKGATWLASRLA